MVNTQAPRAIRYGLLGLTRPFYDRARELTREHGALFVVDSIQAALRAHGCLSIVDYPGFEGCDPPDLETVLDAVTDDLRANIRTRGAEFKAKLEGLAKRYPDTIVEVLGTGLVLCAEIDPDQLQATGPGGLEERLRLNGIEMIHGGRNGLRLTPHFTISSEEIDLVVDTITEVIDRALAEDRAALQDQRPEQLEAQP